MDISNDTDGTRGPPPQEDPVVRILGSLVVNHSGRALVGKKQRLLLALLAANAPDVVRTPALLAAPGLYDVQVDPTFHRPGDREFDQAYNALAKLATQVRRALAGRVGLTIGRQFCQMHVTSDDDVDVLQLRRAAKNLAQQLRAGNGAGALAAAHRIRDEFDHRVAPELSDEFLLDHPLTFGLRNAFLSAHHEAYEPLLRTELPKAALASELQQVVESYPYADRAVALLVQAWLDAGVPALAVRAYEDRVALAAADIRYPLSRELIVVGEEIKRRLR